VLYKILEKQVGLAGLLLSQLMSSQKAKLFGCCEALRLPAVSEWVSHKVKVGDDTILDVFQFRQHGRENTAPREVVLLSVGFGNNCKLLDLLEEQSLAYYLGSGDFDVWTFDYRGHGGSTTKGRKWDMSVYAFEDAVSVIAFILNRTGQRAVHWVGHSMAGMIGLALASCRNTSHYLESVTAVASSIYLRNSLYWYVLNLTPALPLFYCLGGVDMASLTYSSSVSLSSTPCLPSCGMIDKVSSAANTGSRKTHTLMRRGFCWEPFGVIRDLKKGFLPGGVSLSYPAVLAKEARREDPSNAEDELRTVILQEESHIVEISGSIGLYCSKICLIYGTDDKQIAPADVERLAADIKRNIAAKDDAVFCIVPCGRQLGHKPYSHFDLVIGEDAPIDVFPKIGQFLKSLNPNSGDKSLTLEP